MVTTLLMPPMVISILILLFNSVGCSSPVNKTASEWLCDGSENCLVGDESSDLEFLMETDTSRMLLDNQKFQTPNTNNPNKQAAPKCGRPGYGPCIGEANGIPIPENCGVRNRIC